MSRWFGLCIVGVAVALISSARADEDQVRAKFEKAKATYEADVEKYRVAVADWFDKREEAARAKGDKKVVDQVTGSSLRNDPLGGLTHLTGYEQTSWNR